MRAETCPNIGPPGSFAAENHLFATDETPAALAGDDQITADRITTKKVWNKNFNIDMNADGTWGRIKVLYLSEDKIDLSTWDILDVEVDLDFQRRDGKDDEFLVTQIGDPGNSFYVRIMDGGTSLEASDLYDVILI